MKRILTLFFALIMSISLFGCDKEKPVIAFSTTPFSRETGYSPQNNFKVGEKIYYAVYNPKGFNTRLLKLQVFKKEVEKSGDYWGYEYLYNNTLELKNKYAYTDYVIVHNTGRYFFQIFDFTDFQEPVVMGVINVVAN